MKNQSLKNRTVGLLLFFGLLSLIVRGQFIKKIDSMALVHHNKGFNGNVLLSSNDSIVFTGNYGYSDFSNKKALNDSTIFELASVSKQFTALAIVQLKEKGLLEYSTKVSEIINNFPYDNITIEHLLRHQSGLPDYQDIFYNKKYWKRNKIAYNQDVIDVLVKLKLDLVFKPGSQYDYNNTGYVILASIIEKLSGQSFKSYVHKNIFEPSGMSTAYVYGISENHQTHLNIAKGYTYNDRQDKYQKVENDKRHRHIHWMNGIVGDRGIYASILDLEKWKKALRYNKLITEEGKSDMLTVDTISSKYGFGFAIYETESKGRWVYHNGSWSGYKTSAIYLPESNEYLIILSNNRYKETYNKLEEDLYHIILKNTKRN
ncbi:MAG: serine hydrolase domain-containing protein [Allomuricauda sp.]|jgi:CubicO group peptidase (beta-lactamase class C family)